MTACPAPHRTTKYTAVGSSAVSVFGLEDAGWADVLLEQSCLRCAKRLSGAHLPSCCVHINCPNRILDGPRKFRCVCISLLRPSPLPVRGKPIRWGWLSLLTVVVFARRRLPTSFLMRAHCPSTPQISTRSSQRAAYDGPPPVHVRCARSRALPLDPHAPRDVCTGALWLARGAPAPRAAAFASSGSNHGTQGSNHGTTGTGSNRGTEGSLALMPSRRIPSPHPPRSSPPPRSPPPCLLQAAAGSMHVCAAACIVCVSHDKLAECRATRV